ncbi:hypothetical protein BH11MYX3_BH11MYX3_30900 [soil metagenome]
MPVRKLLARHGWLIAIAAAYLYVFPYFPSIQSANELPRVYLTQAMVNEQTFHIDTGVNHWGGTVDVSPSLGHLYSNKAPGSSMLAAPAYAVLKLFVGEPSLAVSVWLCRVVSGVLPTLVFLWLLWGFLARFAPDENIRKLVLLGYALGSMAMTYSVLFFSHQLGAVCVGSAWILAIEFTERKRGLWAMAGAGALAGAALLVDYQAVFGAVPVAVLVVVRIRTWPRADLLRALGAAAAGAAIPIALLLGYHTLAFGRPFRTGYDASTTFASFHQQGFLGITKLRWEAFWGSMFQADNGLFMMMPWVALAIPGAVTLAKKGERAVVATAVAAMVIYILFISSINFWRGGWGVGPRYITAMLPFTLPLVAAQLQAWKPRPLVLGAAAGTILVGVAIYCLSNITFPYWPDNLRNPLVEIVFRLLGDNVVAGNLGSAIGIGGIAGLVPYFALIAVPIGFALVGAATWRGAVIAVALAGAFLVAYAQLPQASVAQSQRVYGKVRAHVLDICYEEPCPRIVR